MRSRGTGARAAVPEEGRTARAKALRVRVAPDARGGRPLLHVAESLDVFALTSWGHRGTPRRHRPRGGPRLSFWPKVSPQSRHERRPGDDAERAFTAEVSPCDP
jgi:hypothetical protein